MFDNLTRRLSLTFAKIAGKTHLTHDMLDDALSEIRVALLEADVALPVVKKIVTDIKEKSVGQKIIDGTKPAEMVAKIVYDELITILGGVPETHDASDDFRAPSAGMATQAASGLYAKKSASSSGRTILMAGLQGTGKTTTAGKLALFFKNNGYSVLLASTDIYRPSAREQLEMLARTAGVDSLPIIENETVSEIAKRIKSAISNHKSEITIIDTAGRLQIDAALMSELAELKKVLTPTDVLLTIDAMAGQESLNVAREFNNTVGITGLVMTRADGDARGGAILSARVETGAPVVFTGTGERIENLAAFYPDRVASQILGMGDVVSLVEKAAEHIDEKEAEKTVNKMFSGEFDLNDMMKQIKQIKKMGSIGSIMKLIPGMGQIAGALKDKATDSAINKQLAIISSMTPAERAKPDIIFASRKQRIATGSGTTVRDVEQVLKSFEKMQAQMKQLQKMGGVGGMMDMMKKMQNSDA